jgi:hypothetical protein
MNKIKLTGIPVLFIVIFSLSATPVFAQGVEREGKTTANASQIYVEAGGAGVIYSVNYDGRFAKLENGVGLRIGIGGASFEGDGYVVIPVQVNYLIGNRGQYLELGGGFTYISLTDIFDSNENSQVMGTATIGFRRQPFGKKGITYRVAFTPFFGSFGLQPWAGASIGFRF